MSFTTDWNDNENNENTSHSTCAYLRQPLPGNKKVQVKAGRDQRPWARRWINHKLCDTWPVRRQTYGHLPSLGVSLPFDWYQAILLGDRDTQV